MIDSRLFTLIEEDLKSKLTDTTEIRVIMSIFEQLKWKISNYRDKEEMLEITFYDSGQVENEDGIKVWRTVGTRKVKVKSPFYEDNDLCWLINYAVDMIRFIFDEAVRFKRMYSHYEIHGVTYNPWMTPDDKFIREHKENTVMVYDWKCSHNDIYSIIRDRDIFYKEYYTYKGKYYKIYDVVLKQEYIKQEVDNVNPETGESTKKEVEIPCSRVYLFINKVPELESHYKYDFNTYENTEERLKKDDLEKDVYFISELKKSYDMACKDKAPVATSVGTLINMHLMRLTPDDRKTVMERCGMIKEQEEK